MVKCGVCGCCYVVLSGPLEVSRGSCWSRSTNASPLSRKKGPLLGEFWRSERRATGRTCTSSLTELSIPTTDGVFLWTIVLCIFSSPRALSVLFCQYGLLMPLRTRVTASSFGISFPAADISRGNAGSSTSRCRHAE